MLSDLFDYVETYSEMYLPLRNFKRYYNSVKLQLESEYVRKEIGHIAMSIETDLKYISHCYFIDVTTFVFFGRQYCGAS